MPELIEAKLVLMEPGAQSVPTLAHAGEQTVLVLGADESPDGFRRRVRHCTDRLRRRSRSLAAVAYVVGTKGRTSWSMRGRLISELCNEVAPDGSVAVVAPSAASADVFGCLGDVQATRGRGCALRAVFTDAPVTSFGALQE